VSRIVNPLATVGRTAGRLLVGETADYQSALQQAFFAISTSTREISGLAGITEAALASFFIPGEMTRTTTRTKS